MNCKIHLTLALLATLGCQTVGKLIEKPRDTEVKVNHSTYLNCSTDYGSTAIFWFHRNKFVYTGNVILQPYHERFEIDRNVFNGTYIYNLIIYFVQPDDAGKYMCEEDEGAGEKSSAQLIVLENDPECQSNVQPDGVIGQNIFNIPQDDIQLTCNATFYGSVPPQIEWKKVQDGRPFQTSLASTVISKNRLTSTLKVKGDISLDKSSFVCQTTRSTKNQYNCASDIIKVLYFVDGNTTEQNVIRGDTISCTSSNSTFPCTSQWYHDNYSCPLSCDETITTHLLGAYMCTVNCHVRGRDYNFVALKAYVAEPIQSPLPSTAESTLLIIYVSVAVIVTLAVVGALSFVSFVSCWRRVSSVKNVAEEECRYWHAIKGREVAEEKRRLLDALSVKNSKIAEEKRGLLEELPAINGIAVLEEEVFIARERYVNIAVYDSKSFDFKRNITVDGMIHAEPIVSCSEKKCLYTFVRNFEKALTVNFGNDPAKENYNFRAQDPFNAMLRIDPSNGKLVKDWEVVEGGGRLSVANDTNVILNINYAAKLHEYTADGELIRVIDLALGTGILRAWHAVKLPNGLFVICQGCKGDPVNRVCLLSTKTTTSTDGRVRIDEVIILKEFGGEKGEQRLYYPMYLSTNKKESILVSDINLVLLSSDLHKPRILIEREVTWLWSTCFDESTRRWFVTGGNRIMVFQEQDEQIIEQRLGVDLLTVTPER